MKLYAVFSRGARGNRLTQYPPLDTAMEKIIARFMPSSVAH